MRCLERRVCDENDLRVVPRLEALHPVAFFIQEVGCNLDGQLGNDLDRALLARLFANDAKYCQRKRFDAANRAEARATRAGLVAGLAERWPQALPRHLQQPEARNLADLHAGAILPNGFTQAVFDRTLVLLRSHVDEVDHDEAAQVADAQLAGNFVGRFQVRIQRGRLDVSALGRPRRVDVDGHQCLGVVDDDTAAGGKRNVVRKCRFDL